MDQLNGRWLPPGRWKPLRSILFPLLGVRFLERDAYEVTTDLVRTARNYLQTWPDVQIERVYFLAYTKRDRELIEAAFNRLNLRLGAPK